MPNHYIAIAGIMGSGKTTASKILKRELGLPLLEEKPHKNPFLADFYKDMKRWALRTQLFYVLYKIQQNIQAKNMIARTSVIHDSPSGQDMVYAKTQQVLGNFTTEEYKLIARIIDMYKPQMIEPDLLIVLDAPINLILKRISMRGRGYEQKVPKSYITALHSVQKKWIAKYPRNKKIIIPMEKFELKEKKHQDAFLKLILNLKQPFLSPQKLPLAASRR